MGTEQLDRDSDSSHCSLLWERLSRAEVPMLIQESHMGRIYPHPKIDMGVGGSVLAVLLLWA
jgi:hypothetical protein